MKERPILFGGAMVRAILAGVNSQTRRVVRITGGDGIEAHRYVDAFAPYAEHPGVWEMGESHGGALAHVGSVRCPYGVVGDRLWVRETFALGTQPRQAFYLEARLPGHANTLKWRPSIFMPRWASRITLEITNIRVERLQRITKDDSRAEGIGGISVRGEDTTRMAFAHLWDTINSKRAPWASNPWVWVVEFRRIVPAEAAA